MKPEGKSADQILANPLKEHASWHFFQAASWLDFAKRLKNPSALQYAAMELRYGVEYQLYQLLVLSGMRTEKQYQKCLGNPKAMKKMLESSDSKYEKHSDFTRILMSLVPNAPQMRYWSLTDLFKYWGIASEFLHFFGDHSRTNADREWLNKSVGRLEKVIFPIKEALTKTQAVGLINRSSMEPEVKQAWEEFSAGTLDEENLKLRMKIIQPILKARNIRKQFLANP
jgi:hypothetical protein